LLEWIGGQPEKTSVFYRIQRLERFSLEHRRRDFITSLRFYFPKCQADLVEKHGILAPGLRHYCLYVLFPELIWGDLLVRFTSAAQELGFGLNYFKNFEDGSISILRRYEVARPKVRPQGRYCFELRKVEAHQLASEQDRLTRYGLQASSLLPGCLLLVHFSEPKDGLIYLEKVRGLIQMVFLDRLREE
jgi:hypothetical protein